MQQKNETIVKVKKKLISSKLSTIFTV